MISPTAFKKNGQAWSEKNPVGTGAFQFVSWTKDVNVKFKKFDEYWAGKPYIDGIDVILYTDLTVALMDFKAGNLDSLTLADPKNMKEIEAAGKYNAVLTPDMMNPVLMGNSKDPKSPFAKLEVRQALSYAIDQETLAKTIGLGYFKAENQLAVPGNWGNNPKVVGYPYNPGKAKELLASAGYPNGFDTTLNYYAYNITVTDQVTALQQMLKPVGINVKLNPMTKAIVTEAASKGWDGLLRVNFFSSPDPLTLLSGITGGQYTNLNLPDEFKQLADKAITEGTVEGKQKAVQELMSLSTDKYAMFSFLPMEVSDMVKSKRVHDDLYGELPNRYLSPKVWISE